MHLRYLAPLAALLLPPSLGAQSTTPSDSAVDPAMVIREIQLERREIFDPHERGWVARMANRLHFQTRPSVIRRELLFRVGQPYDSALVAESERNLRSLGLFRHVRIDSVRTPTGLVLRVVTKDGWTTQADWRFRSTGGEAAFTIGLVEQNLLGTASAAAIRYRKNPDRSTIGLSFRRARLVAGTIGLGLQYENRSDGNLSSIVIDRPFFSLNSRNAFRLDLEDRDERILRFTGGLDEATDTLSRRFAVLRGSAAWAVRASNAGYTRVGMVVQVRRDDFIPVSSTGPFPRTITATVGPYLVWSRARFLVTSGYGGFAREEDVDLGTTVRVGLLAAPRTLGYDRDGIGSEFAGRVGAKIPSGFAYLDVAANGLYSPAGLDSGSVQLGVTTVLQPGRRHLAVFHLMGGMIENPTPGEEFDLGLGSGPRAFGSHAFTGDRAFFAMAEYRVTVAEDLLGLVGLGVAGFVDYGGAWFQGSRRRVGWDAGVGLRVGPSRSTATDALRFDLARRFANDAEPGGWVVTVGKGFAFASSTRKPS